MVVAVYSLHRGLNEPLISFSFQILFPLKEEARFSYFTKVYILIIANNLKSIRKAALIFNYESQVYWVIDAACRPS